MKNCPLNFEPCLFPFWLNLLQLPLQVELGKAEKPQRVPMLLGDLIDILVDLIENAVNSGAAVFFAAAQQLIDWGLGLIGKVRQRRLFVFTLLASKFYTKIISPIFKTRAMKSVQKRVLRCFMHKEKRKKVLYLHCIAKGLNGCKIYYNPRMGAIGIFVHS